jgi:DNA repair protein RecN (Recombination protein N)
MLEEINIENLGVIQRATLEFAPGLNVITGETGAGKTMVLTALGLLLGKRSDASIVREGTGHASVEGCWNLEGRNIISAIQETGAVLEEDVNLFINRTVHATGKNRIVVGGKTTPASVLSGFAEGLVSIHGQADQIRLKTPAAQRDALDKYAGQKLVEIKGRYRDAYKEAKRLKELLDDVKKNSAHRSREYELYKQALEDFEKVRPEAGEDDKLKSEINTLTHIETIREGATEAYGSLVQEEYDSVGVDVLGALSQAARALSGIAEYDPELAALLEQAENVRVEAQELSSALSSYLSNIDEDALSRLAESQERLAAVNSIIRKYGSTLDEAMNYWAEAEEKVNALNPENNDIETLETECVAAHKELMEVATELHKTREEAAKKLTEAVNEELAGLAMAGNKLVIKVTMTDTPTSHGADEIAFLLKTPGSSDPRPIGKTASGGELSRIMLALEVVLADPSTTATFVYDEVDAGVGGAVALEIGKRLARLARDAQVIVVSHLAQVAAFADNHLKVKKTASDAFVSTDVQVLEPEARITELARLLSGLEDSETGRAHALELLELAQQSKA